MPPLAGPRQKFLSQNLRCYLRNSPATSPQKPPPVSFATLPSPGFLSHHVCCLLSFLHKNKPKSFFKKSALCLSSAAERTLCLQVINILLDVSLYCKPAVELRGLCYGGGLGFFPKASGLRCKELNWKELNSSLPGCEDGAKGRDVVWVAAGAALSLLLN